MPAPDTKGRPADTRSSRSRELLENDNVFCALPWLHLHGSIEGVWGRCCLDNTLSYQHYYEQPTRPVMKLASGALGCSPASPMAVDNPNQIFGLKAAFNSPNLRRTRLAMIRGERVEACRYCYAQEAIGGTSHRQAMNQMFGDSEDWEALIADTGDDGTLERQPIFLDLRLGNHCNLRCVMCCFPISSSWKRHVEGTWLKGALDPYHEDDAFWEEMRQVLPGLRRLYFAGGEPMLQPSHHRLLEEILEGDFAAQIDLTYTTNLTVLPAGILDKLARFRSVGVGASCDGFGATFEKIRRGASWSDFERNLRRIRSHVDLRLTVTPQRDNVDDLPRLVRWALGENYTIDLANILQFPTEMRLDNLDVATKARHAPEYASLAATCRKADHSRVARELEVIHHLLTTNCGPAGRRG